MFGPNGVARFGFGLYPKKLAVLADGSIVAADDHNVWHVSRNGVLDTTFGTGGTLSFYGAGSPSVWDLVAMPDGDFNIVDLLKVSLPQYTASGALDKSYGLSGYATASITGLSQEALALTNGKVVVGIADGMLAPVTLRVARFDAQGRLDATFGGDGVADTGLALWYAHTSIAVQPDGAVAGLIAGSTSVATGSPLEERLFLFSPNGQLTAQVVVGLGFDDKVLALGDGSWLVGRANWFSGLDPITRVIKADGSDDVRTSVFNTSLAGLNGWASFALDHEGRVLIAGNFSHVGHAEEALDTTVIRLLPDGSLDKTFSDDGIAHFRAGVDPAEGDLVVGIDVGADDKVVVLGSTAAAPPNPPFYTTAGYLARLNTDGTLDVVSHLQGSAQSETLTGTAGDNAIHALAGDDVITGRAGDDTIEGGDGFDVAVYSGPHTDYHTETVGSSVHVSDSSAWRDGSDTLVGIERIEFNDGVVAFDITGHAGQAYRLYQAAFARVPDVPGLGYQTTALDTGLSLTQVAANFIASPEFQSLYGQLDDSQFLTQLYANVLHRSPDAGGLAYHLANLHAGVPRSYVLVGFSESPENQANVIGSIKDGMFFTL